MIKTILLLDDDPDEQFILRDAFASLQLEVDFKQVLTFPELLQELDRALVLPDMLLLDVNLPEQTGVEAIRFLKNHSHYSALSIVMYTNASDDHTINECFDLGASAYMKKTTTLAKLEEHLRNLLAWNTQTVFNIPVTERTFLN